MLLFASRRTVAAFFCLALFFWPVFVIIPPQATAPALVLVGILMLQGLTRIDMMDFGNATPIVLTLLVTVLTNNLINGMALGTLSYLALEVTMGRRSHIPAMVRGLGVVFIAYGIVTAPIMKGNATPRAWRGRPEWRSTPETASPACPVRESRATPKHQVPHS